MTDRFEFQIKAKYHKFRLDDFLYAEFPHLSRMYLRELVRDGNCDVNGVHENRGYVLRSNDFVEIFVDRARQTSLQPEDLPLEIIFEDADLLVVDKPSGMLVHPTVRIRSGTLLNAVAHHLNTDGAGIFRRGGLVHRLDKDTSGLVVIAKTLRAHRILARHFQRKLVEKTYVAVVAGGIGPDSGSIEAPIGRFPELRVWAVKDDGKPSVSNYRVVRRPAGATVVELEPVTGRTNQLRIHMAHIGHPIVGDVKYGGPEFPRLCLHARTLGFNHPVSGEHIALTAEPPPEMEFFGERT
jgi:23S rRNA pseudouridine1911/1915/1917 synthase